MAQNSNVDPMAVVSRLMIRMQAAEESRDQALARAKVVEAERDAFVSVTEHLLAMIRKEAGWSRPEDQMLVRQAAAMVAEMRRK